MPVIRFALNCAQVLHVQTLEGKVVESQFGGFQHLFTAREGTFYVSDKVGGILTDQFRKLGVQPGDPVEITKAEVGRGQERRTQWLVATNAQSQPQPGELAVAKTPEPPSKLEQQLADSIRLVEARKEAARSQTAAPAEQPRWAQTLEQQTRHLVNVYASVLLEATKLHGALVKPDDVRSLLLTCFINLSKQGARSDAA